MIGRLKELEDVGGVTSSFPTYLGKIEATLLAGYIQISSAVKTPREHLDVLLQKHTHTQTISKIVGEGIKTLRKENNKIVEERKQKN